MIYQWLICGINTPGLHFTDVSLMLTSSNGNIFRVTGHLCGEFTGHRWIPRTKASDVELWCFQRLKERLSKQSWGWWFETPSRPLCRHCNTDIACPQGGFCEHVFWRKLLAFLNNHNTGQWSLPPYTRLSISRCPAYNDIKYSSNTANKKSEWPRQCADTGIMKAQPYVPLIGTKQGQTFLIPLQREHRNDSDRNR